MKNFDHEILSNPVNEEYFEAIQEKNDAERNKFINSLSLEDKSRFLNMERLVGEMDKLDVPFMLFINPFGYNFKVEGGGFWRYQRFHPHAIAGGSRESLASQSLCIQYLFPTVLNFLTLLFEDVSAYIYNKGVAWFGSRKGQSFNPPSNNNKENPK